MVGILYIHGLGYYWAGRRKGKGKGRNREYRIWDLGARCGGLLLVCCFACWVEVLYTIGVLDFFWFFFCVTCCRRGGVGVMVVVVVVVAVRRGEDRNISLSCWPGFFAKGV